MPQPTRTLVYGSVPHVSGTFTFYRMLRAGLADHGWDVRCVSIGAREAAGVDPAFVDDGCVTIASGVEGVEGQARAFVDWCAAEQPDVVMPMNSRAMLSALPHLPQSVSVVTRCPNTSPYGYSVAAAYANRTARIVGTTPRHARELEAGGVDPAKLTVIPHGIDVSAYDAPERNDPGPIRLAYLGRLEHNWKGVLYLPEIGERLWALGVPFVLRVAGSGELAGELEAAFASAGLRGDVQLLGAIAPSDVPGFLAGADVLVFPSREEGFGFVQVQALAAGAVLVASHLPGITDFVLTDGETGLLCPIGDAAAFARAIARLDADRDALRRMSRAARASAEQRFDARRMAAAYADVFEQVLGTWQAPAPEPFDRFRLHPALRRSWRARIPRPIRRLLRRALYRAGLSERHA